MMSIICFLLATVEPGPGGRAAVPQDHGEIPEIWVSNGRGGCPGADFYSIQDAVNAAQSGDTIRICAGEYAEQVVVRKPIKLVADIGVVLLPEHMVQNALSLSTGEPLAAVILVTGADVVDVMGFSVDAKNNGISGCAPRLIGILYQNASGKITSNSLSHVRSQNTTSTCHSGNAIEAQSGNGGHSKVDIHDNAVDDYQVNAITANGAGTDVGIDENEITTSNPKGGVPLNGIQVAFGASGAIENNTIAADLSSKAPRCASNSAGVLVFETNGVYVASNSVESTKTGIFVVGNRSRVIGNNFPACSPAQAIAVLGDENEIADNKLPRSSERTIFIRGEKNRTARNQVSGGLRGRIEVADFRDNLISDDAFSVIYELLRGHRTTAVPKPTPSR